MGKRFEVWQDVVHGVRREGAVHHEAVVFAEVEAVAVYDGEKENRGSHIENKKYITLKCVLLIS